RARRVLLDKHREPDAEVPAARALTGLQVAQRPVFHELEQPVETGLVRQPARLHAGRCRTGRAEVAPAKLGRVDFELARAGVEREFHGGADDRLADAAIRAGRRLVLPDDAQATLI